MSDDLLEQAVCAANKNKEAPAKPNCEWAVDAIHDDAYLPGCSKRIWSRYYDTPTQDGYVFCPVCGKPTRFVGES